MTPLWVPGTHRQNTEPWPVGGGMEPPFTWRCQRCGSCWSEDQDTCMMCDAPRYPGPGVVFLGIGITIIFAFLLAAIGLVVFVL